jgi:hypothetical protein
MSQDSDDESLRPTCQRCGGELDRERGYEPPTPHSVDACIKALADRVKAMESRGADNDPAAPRRFF